MAPWADALYAMDRAWWRVHIDEVRRVFGGVLWSPLVGIAGVKRVNFGGPIPRNSGAGAIGLAARLGARRIVLLGYDVQLPEGRAHWHGDHPKGLGNAGSIGQWPEQFRLLARTLAGLEVVNASRSTALECFPRESLEDALEARTLQ